MKTAAIGLPLGGGKGGVVVNPRDLSDEELEELSRQYAAHLHPHIGPDKDIPAPDVNTDSRIIDWMVDEYEKQTGDTSHASFTGKSLGKGGSEGRAAATGRGGVFALREALKHDGLDKKPIRLAVQGFGNVGAYFATVGTKDHPNWQLVAAADTSATLAGDQLNAQELSDFKTKRGRFQDFQGTDVKVADADEIFSADVDILVLAALENAITADNMKQVKAKYILELANGPIDSEAYDYLVEQGKIIIPDIIANSGGVIVSYLEWVQNKANEHWSEDKVNQQLEEYIVNAADALYKTARQYDVPLKEAAFINGVLRLTEKSS